MTTHIPANPTLLVARLCRNLAADQGCGARGKTLVLTIFMGFVHVQVYNVNEVDGGGGQKLDQEKNNMVNGNDSLPPRLVVSYLDLVVPGQHHQESRNKMLLKTLQ
ncbi:uncharacterized protein [Asterias amurensis]|uniref:uncharacterized protein n=1 Tax=Asterias amurensis TaxID=7602 RepID=UPI003AB65C74